MEVSRPDKTSVEASRIYLFAIVLVATAGGFLFGYDFSLISGVGVILRKEFSLTPFWFGVVTGSAVGSPLFRWPVFGWRTSSDENGP